MSSSGDTRLSAEAQRRGSASTVAREAEVSLNTVKRGLREREAGETYHPGARIRRPGAGRKQLAHTDPTLLTDLEQLLEPKGDPMSLVRWTTKSLAHLVQALSASGHHIKKSALADLLHAPTRYATSCHQASFSRMRGRDDSGSGVRDR